ncbi:unnamed protein product [Cutaneotrichosporon oleaginosum]
MRAMRLLTPLSALPFNPFPLASHPLPPPIPNSSLSFSCMRQSQATPPPATATQQPLLSLNNAGADTESTHPPRPRLRLDTRPEVLSPSLERRSHPSTPSRATHSPLSRSSISPRSRTRARRPRRRDAMEPRTVHFVGFLQRMHATLDAAAVGTVSSAGGGAEATVTATAMATGEAIMAALEVYFPSLAREPAAWAAVRKGSLEARVTALHTLVLARVPPEGDPARH